MIEPGGLRSAGDADQGPGVAGAHEPLLEILMHDMFEVPVALGDAALLHRQGDVEGGELFSGDHFVLDDFFNQLLGGDVAHGRSPLPNCAADEWLVLRNTPSRTGTITTYCAGDG